MARIAIAGVTGSGKSTLAAEVALRTGARHVASDEIYWLPGWVVRPDAERRALYEEALSGNDWVVDSLPTTARDLILARADLVVALDLPARVVLPRLLRRTVRRIVTREEICNGNRETLRGSLGRDSILVWYLRSRRAKSGLADEIEATVGAPPVLRLTSDQEIAAWLASMGR